MLDLFSYSAVDIGKLIQKKQIGVAEITSALLERIEDADSSYHAYLRVFRKEALKRAACVQKEIDEEQVRSPLHGVPIALKDNICTKGLLTTCASKMLETFYPPYNATVVDRLLKSGAVLIGKLNMDEFAMGSTTETSFFGPTQNPWDISHAPGGSSGGAAAALAAREAYCALGSDTGGSIRLPSSYCGVCGIKPTYGSVSRYGLVAYASSLDQIGPMARDIRDLCAILDLIMGKDPLDPTTIETSPSFFTQLKPQVKGLKIGLPEDYFASSLNNDVKDSVLSCASLLESLGAVIEPFSLPFTEYVIPAYYVLASAEASSNLARYDGIRYGLTPESLSNLEELYFQSRSLGFGPEVKRRITLGNFVLSSGYYDAYYKKALQTKMLIQQAFQTAFKKYDLILSPTAPTTAPKLGKSLVDPLAMYLGDIYTVSANLAGIPAISFPCGFDANGLPIGAQLMGKTV